MREVKTLNYIFLSDFLSERQLSEHHDVLYAGYVNKLNEIEEKLPSADKGKANATFSDFRALKKEEVFAQNGILLHELYFENISPAVIRQPAEEAGRAVPEALQQSIEKDFGSLDAWQEDFLACGMSSRGWVIMAQNPTDGRLHNYIADIHDVGGVWGVMPLLVLDMYEHSYFIDYGTKKKDYINAFIKNINWDVAENRFSR